MDLGLLREVLIGITDESSAEYLAARDAATKYPPDMQDVLLEHHLAERLMTALSNQPEFWNGVGFMIEEPGGAVGFHAQDAAAGMLRLVRGGESAERALEWLQRILATDHADGLSVMALWGVSVERATALTDEISLIPIDAVPKSAQLEWLLRPRDFAQVLHFVPFSLKKAPLAALTMPTRLSRVLIDAKVNDGERRPPSLAQLQALDEARLALTVVGPSAPLQAAAWFQFDDPDLQRVAAHSGIRGTHHEIVPWGYDPEVVLDPGRASASVRAYLGLDETTRNKVRLSLQRLNQAVRRIAHADKALELGIALEALLTEGGGENTYKVGLRAGLLTEGPEAARLHNRALISALYIVRSSVAHDGTVPDKVKVIGTGRTSSTEVVDQCLEIVAYLLRRVMQQGSVPDWYKFELGHRGTD